MDYESLRATIQGYKRKATLSAQDYSTEQNLFIWNTNGDYIELAGVFISDTNFTNGDVLTAKLYQYINGVESFMKSLDHTKTAVVGGILIISGNYPVTERVRFTLQSSPGRNVAVPYSAAAKNYTVPRAPFS